MVSGLTKKYVRSKTARTYRSSGASNETQSCADYYAGTTNPCPNKELSNEPGAAAKRCEVSDSGDWRDCVKQCCVPETKYKCSTFNANEAINCKSLGLTVKSVSDKIACQGDDCVELCCNTTTCGNFRNVRDACTVAGKANDNSVGNDTACTNDENCVQVCCKDDVTKKTCGSSKSLCEAAGLEYNAGVGDATECTDCQETCCVAAEKEDKTESTCSAYRTGNSSCKASSAAGSCSLDTPGPDHCETKCCKVSFMQKLTDFYQKNKNTVLIGSGVVLLAVVGAVAFMVNKRNRRRR